nr:glycosyltransferase family 2 protein [Acuticoccus mangrovi]
MPVSVVIPVRNEAAILGECLARLSPFAEVIVVDSASEDGTAAIARAAGARVVEFVWNGRYPKKRNHVLLNEPIAAPWVLFLDADELVTEEFCAELAARLPESRAAGYWLGYRNTFLGRPLRHGVPQRKLALIRHGHGLYERIDEREWSPLDMEVHEHPVLDGPAETIRAPLLHRDERGLAAFLDRHLAYARWEAARYLALETGDTAALTPRQRFKYRHLDAWWYAPLYFGLCTLLKGGLLDGRAGLAYAFYKAWYFATIRFLIRERRRAMAP